MRKVCSPADAPPLCAQMPSRATVTASRSPEQRRPLCVSSLQKQRDFWSWWVSLWLQRPGEVITVCENKITKKKTAHGWRVQQAAWTCCGGVNPGSCSTPAQHPHVMQHIHRNDSRLGSVVAHNKSARVAVKWILSLFTSPQLAMCIIYLMAFALFSRRFSGFTSSVDNSELRVRWEGVTLIAESWRLKLSRQVY